MARVWIVHREQRWHALLARMAGLAAEDFLAAEPGAAAFDAAPAPRVIVLALSGDLEAELEFAHRAARRLRGVRWLLLAEPKDAAEARRLFDLLAAEPLAFPPRAEELRSRVQAALQQRSAERLSERSHRDRVAARFSRYFAELELPELLRALDPRLGGVPLLIRGEPGTGRGLLAQYVHAFGGSAGTELVFLPCAGLDGDAVLPALFRAARGGLAAGPGAADAAGLTLCLEDVDELSPGLQRELLRWIEFAPPGELVRASRLRWMATVGDDLAGALSPKLSPELAQALAGISVRIPTLRECTEDIPRLAQEAARVWWEERGQRPVELSREALEELQAYPWPGNRRELEAVVWRTLAMGLGSGIRAGELRFDPAGPTPGPAEAVPASEPIEPPRAETVPPEAAPPRAAAPETIPAPEAAPPAAPQPEQPAEASGETPPATGPELLRRLAQSLAHEIRNPLVAIRTFTELLPERFEDPEFRAQFGKLVAADVSRIETVVQRLADFAAFEPGTAESLDVSALLESLLEERREEIRRRRLLVLKELERAEPRALGHAAALGFAFEAILERALRGLPDRADLYVASKHHPRGPRGEAWLRTLVRFHRPGPGSTASPDAPMPDDVALELLLAELVLRAEGGRLTVDDADASETVIVVDLPAPPA